MGQYDYDLLPLMKQIEIADLIKKENLENSNLMYKKPRFK